MSRDGFERQRASLDRGKEPTPDFFLGQKVDHYVESNDLYVEVAARLERTLGPYPVWEWRNEGRSFRRYEVAGRRFAHQPDAEIRLPGRLFYFERQTRRARYGQRQIRKKVAAYQTYADHVLGPGARGVEILFACDFERERRAAVEAGHEFGLDVAASTVKGIAAHLEAAAQRQA